MNVGELAESFDVLTGSSLTAKEIAQREFCILILVAGMMPTGGASTGWAKRHGMKIIRTAEAMADMLQMNKFCPAGPPLAPESDGNIGHS